MNRHGGSWPSLSFKPLLGVTRIATEATGDVTGIIEDVGDETDATAWGRLGAGDDGGVVSWKLPNQSVLDNQQQISIRIRIILKRWWVNCVMRTVEVAGNGLLTIRVSEPGRRIENTALWSTGK